MTQLVSQIAVQTGVIAANTVAVDQAARRERRDRSDRPRRTRSTAGAGILGKAGGALAGLASGITGPIVAAIAPMALLASTISQTTSGFGPFLKMVGLVTTLLAGLFLPAMLVASGVVFAMAMAIQGPLMGAMEELAMTWIPILIDGAVGVYESFEQLANLGDALGIQFSDLAFGTLPGVILQLNELGISLRDVMKILRRTTLLGIAAEMAPGKQEVKESGPPSRDVPQADGGRRRMPPRSSDGRTKPSEGVGGFVADIRKGMDLAMRSMRQDIAPPAQFGQDMMGVWRAATLAGLNEDPIAAEQKRIMLEQLDRMDKMLAELAKRSPQYQ